MFAAMHLVAREDRLTLAAREGREPYQQPCIKPTKHDMILRATTGLVEGASLQCCVTSSEVHGVISTVELSTGLVEGASLQRLDAIYSANR
jgi:hypothetical protein